MPSALATCFRHSFTGEAEKRFAIQEYPLLECLGPVFRDAGSIPVLGTGHVQQVKRVLVHHRYVCWQFASCQRILSRSPSPSSGSELCLGADEMRWAHHRWVDSWVGNCLTELAHIETKLIILAQTRGLLDCAPCQANTVIRFPASLEHGQSKLGAAHERVRGYPYI